MFVFPLINYDLSAWALGEVFQVIEILISADSVPFV